MPKLVLEPVSALPGQPQPHVLATTVAIPAGGTAPLTLAARLARSGYQVTIHGQAAIPRARELAHLGGMRSSSALDGLAGEPLTVELNAEGPWMQPQTADAGAATPADSAIARRVSGTLVLHNANWKTEYLANAVEISQATLHLGQDEVRWGPIEFSYGPVKGMATLNVPEICDAPCLPHFEIQFGDLDAAALQAAVLGAHEPGTVISTLIQRLRLSNTKPAPPWPRAEGTITADSLVLGPVTMRDVTANLRTTASGAEFTSLDASLLGGQLHAAGTLETGDKPAYTLTCDLGKLKPAAVGELLGVRSTGSTFAANGKIELSGFTSVDLAASAKGAMHFDWKLGSIAPAPGASPVPAALTRFDRWTGDAEIANGAVTVKQNQAQQGARKRAVEATVTLDTTPKITFPKEPPAKR